MGATGEKSKPSGEKNRGAGEKMGATGEKSKPSGEKNRGAGERVGRNISPQSRALCTNGLGNFFYCWGDGEEIFHPF